MTTVRRPVLRYHGGKWRLAHWILSHFPRHRVYVEPYGGGASVLLRKPRSYSEVYNDLDGEVVNVFRVLRDPAGRDELERLLRLTPYAREEFFDSYQETDDPVERARRTLVRSYMGFGSAATSAFHLTGFRANANRSGTTPAHDWARYPEEIRVFGERLTGVVLENRPALDVIRQQDGPETLIYADPPYLHSTRTFKRRESGQVYRHEMTDKDHIRLAVVLRRRQGYRIVSGYASPLYARLYERRGWLRVEQRAHADGAIDRTECLWLCPRVQAALPQPALLECV